MSMSEPFLPAHEPPAHADPREHDIDGDVDVFIEHDRSHGRHRAGDDTASTADASSLDADGSPVPADAPAPPFRTPEAHHGLTADELERDLDEESDPTD